MNNELKICGSEMISSAEFGQVRIAYSNGEIFFCAQDILRCLDYKSIHRVVASVLSDIPDAMITHLRIMTSFGFRRMVCLSAQGALFFLAHSRRQNATRVHSWIASEIERLQPQKAVSEDGVSITATQSPRQTYDRKSKITPDVFDKTKGVLSKYQEKLGAKDLLAVVSSVTGITMSRTTLNNIANTTSYNDYKELVRSRFQKTHSAFSVKSAQAPQAVADKHDVQCQTTPPPQIMKDMYISVAIKQEITSTREELKEIRALLKSLIDSLT